MLATSTEQCFSGDEWLFERKLDGVRVVCVHDGERVHLWSRNGNNIGEGYPELVEALRQQGDRRFVTDGEIVAFEGAQTSFARLQQRIHLTNPRDIRLSGVEVYLYLFDLPAWQDTELGALPLRWRKLVLREAFDFGGVLRFSGHRNADGEAYYRQACSRGWEGLIAKRADTPYRSGRCRDWLKFKCVREQEFVVGGFTDPSGCAIRGSSGCATTRTRAKWCGRLPELYDRPDPRAHAIGPASPLRGRSFSADGSGRRTSSDRVPSRRGGYAGAVVRASVLPSETQARRSAVKRRNVLVITALAVVVVGYLLIRDPVGAAGAVRGAWNMAVGALSTVAESLTTFLRHLFRG